MGQKRRSAAETLEPGSVLADLEVCGERVTPPGRGGLKPHVGTSGILCTNMRT